MEGRLSDRLKLAQLKGLDAISSLNSGRFDRMSIPEIASALTDSRDLELMAEVLFVGVKFF